MSDWYKMDPAKWDLGTATLSLEEEAAYLRIVNAINKHDAPLPVSDRMLAGMFRCSTRKARSLLNALVAAGKIYIEDGVIWNDRARLDVNSRAVRSKTNAENGSKGGRTRAERAANSLNSHETDQATASSRIEEKRIDEKGKEEPSGSSKNRGSRLPSDWMPDEVFARQEGLSAAECAREAAKFRDHWMAQPGQRGVKLDWAATWKNWVRKAADGRRRDVAPRISSGNGPRPEGWWRSEPEYRNVI